MFPHPIQSVPRVFQQNSQLLQRRPHQEIYETTAAVIPQCDSVEKLFLPTRSRREPAMPKSQLQTPRGATTNDLKRTV